MVKDCLLAKINRISTSEKTRKQLQRLVWSPYISANFLL